MTETERETETQKRPRSRRMLRGVAWGLVLIAVTVGAAFWAMVGRSVSAPDWVRDTVEVRLADALPGFEVLFGDVQLRLERDGRTRIILLDVDGS